MELRERDFYIDRLRSVMIALVVLHHGHLFSFGWLFHAELAGAQGLTPAF
jgi:hypothetical protein